MPPNTQIRLYSLLDPFHDRTQIGLDAEVHIRTLDRALAGLPVRPSSLRRIRRVLEQHGLLHLLPGTPGER